MSTANQPAGHLQQLRPNPDLLLQKTSPVQKIRDKYWGWNARGTLPLSSLNVEQLAAYRRWSSDIPGRCIHRIERWPDSAIAAIKERAKRIAAGNWEEP